MKAMRTNNSREFEFSTEDSLLRRFEAIHDYLYSNDGLSPQQALEEFIKILFVKVHDENNPPFKFFIHENELAATKQGAPAPVFQTRLAALFEQTKQSYPDIYDADERIKVSLSSLAFIVERLQGISLLDSSQDAKGLAFQKFLSHHEKDANGQFFTPPPVIDFCVKMLHPSASEKIIDPACGSGGFLCSVLNYLKKDSPAFDAPKFIFKNLHGIDINKSITRIAKMKLMLEGSRCPGICCANSLDDFKNPPFFREGKFDIVLTNPPFGAKITSPALLQRFELGHKWVKTKSGFSKTTTLQNIQTTEILYIERCLQLLREGGRMVIVLPNGNFENPSLEYLRHYIKRHAKILAIINLPHETFIPFGTGVKTSLLFLRKNSRNKAGQYPIFFGRVTKLGYQGNKNATPSYKKNELGNILKNTDGCPELDEDFSFVADEYARFETGDAVTGQNIYSIGNNEITGRFDFDFYSPENRRILSVLKGRIRRLGELCELVKKKSTKLKNADLEVEYIELSDINTHANEIINSTTLRVHELPSRASYEIGTGDILTAIAGNSVGTRKHATALVTSEFDGAICTNGFRVLRNFKIDPYFLLYFLRSDLFLKQMFMYRTGAAIPNVSDEDLSNIIVSIPPPGRMKEIIRKMKKSFELRDEARRQIEAIAN